MRILTIMLKDLKQIVQEKRTIIFLVIMPVIFTLFMGFAYGSGSNDANADTRIPLGWVDQDGAGELGGILRAKLEKMDTLRLVEIDESAGLEAVRKGEVAGMLVVPAGYSQAALDGQPAQLKLIADPTSTNGNSLYQLLRQPVAQVMSSLEIAALDVKHLEGQGALDSAQRSAEFAAAFQSALGRWDQTDNAARVQTEMAVAAETPDPYGGNPYNQASPGILLMFAMFGLMNSGQVLLYERKSGTLARMLTTSLSPWAAVAGHFLAMFMLTFFQQVLLVAFGQALLGVNYLREPLGVLAVMAALSLATAGLGLLIGAVAKEEQQVSLYSLIVMFAL
nr:ABC transporter permease [Anaerolinea sp.]